MVVAFSPSPYHQIVAIYCRNVQGDLLAVAGPCKIAFQEYWMSLDNSLKSFVLNSPAVVSTSTVFPAPKFRHVQREAESASTGETVLTNVYEYKSPSETHIRGVMTEESVVGSEKAFFWWFINSVLTNSRLDLCEAQGVYNRRAISLARHITEVFSKLLRNVAHGDMWHVGRGKEAFETGIVFYTSRNATIRMVLPAFPCKSTSLDKVIGTAPDKGEELSLRSIHMFVQETKKIYPPGIEFSIVSDGHVFSDCIGADDIVVDKYGEELMEMRDKLFGVEAGREIPFMGLHEMFNLDQESANLMQEIIPETEVPILISTVHTAGADLCRQILVASSGIDGVVLRENIEKSDPAALALYRGFTKFMSEDLAFHPSLIKTSKSKRKKIAAKIAFEMLKRNQAYSNLVEVMFPFHIRLSIHAHLNDGPKFGINLLGMSNCRTAISLLDEIPETSDDLLHIPTPWHNCVVKIAGKNDWFVVKFKTVMAGVMGGICTMEYIRGNDGCGSYVLVTMAHPSRSGWVL